MHHLELYRYGVIAIILAAASAFSLLLFISAPYGRHRRRGFGPALDARLSWLLMESPSVILFAVVFFSGQNALRLVPLILFALWQLHYLQRTFVYPFLMRMKGNKDPLLTVALAIVFNLLNSTLNAMAISAAGLAHDDSWLKDPRFIVGVTLFIAGYTINRHSDTLLRGLRRPGEKGYKIPKGGLFRWVSCPNYFGEILEWSGWALASWSLGGLAFLLFTAANLVPRALSHHRWYLERFPDYPKNRRALVPWIL